MQKDEYGQNQFIYCVFCVWSDSIMADNVVLLRAKQATN